MKSGAVTPPIDLMINIVPILDNDAATEVFTLYSVLLAGSTEPYSVWPV